MSDVIATSELEDWFGAIIAAMRERGIDEIKLDRQYYYSLDSTDVWAMEIDPPEPTVGDVFDDVADLRRDCAAPVGERAGYLWHMIDHLKGPLTLLSAQCVASPIGRL